ncbi:LuxR family transcriptional regulator [Nocardioides sp. TF02-7]|uniref:LuxR family transcriptional regulator n=1 Tax=Nocardioides sp. TF02-7 TaxID=2917724 RepID=UPI001F061DC6|nr:LuxR family transcriptional regulator [Nocardioides sp. TF02-7]UMG93455.1 LuxR family transcriptional regulator [Nocardioides sp. TF02-7]
MEGRSLTELAEEQLTTAREAHSGRSAVTVYGGREHRLRQTLIALRAGARLGEHEAPPEATLQVLSGSVALHAGGADVDRVRRRPRHHPPAAPRPRGHR